MSDTTNKPAFRAVVNLAKEGSEKGYYRDIGTVWPHKSGESYTLNLDVMPLSGQSILLFKIKAKEAQS